MPSCNFAAWMKNADHGVAIVGASGWIGSAMVDQVLEASPYLNDRRLRLFASRERSLTIRGRPLQTRRLDETTRLGDGRWLIIHAGVTGLSSADGRQVNDAILANVLALAETSDASLVAISSGAAKAQALGRPLTPYALMKQEHEAIVAEWAARHRRRILLPRVFNLGGPYMTCARNYALGDILISLAADKRIKLGSGDAVFRSFVHVLEMAGVVLDMAVDELESDAPFDIGGSEIVELGALAHAAAQRLGLDQAAIQRPDPTGRPADWYVGDARRYQTALFNRDRRPLDLSHIIDDTAVYLRDTGLIA